MSANKRARFVIAVIFIVMVIVFALRFIALRGKTPVRSVDEIQAEEGIPVDVMTVERSSISRYMRLLGDIQGYEQVELVSSMAIDVTGILKKEGEAVKKGDVVIRLARDRRGNAYHQFALAEQALGNAERDLERSENLYEEGAISAQMLEKARLGYKNAKSQYTQALSVVDLMSPIDGVVTRVDATKGTAAAPGLPLATVASTGRVRVRCFVGQNEVGLLQQGQKAFICLNTPRGDAIDNPENCGIEGMVSSVSLSADTQTKLFLAEITAENPDGLLKPGLVAAVSVLVEKMENIVTIPGDALVKRESGNFVYLVKEDKAVLTKVDIGTGNGRRFAVKNVSVGDELVIRGQFKLADGAKVKIHESAGGDEK